MYTAHGVVSTQKVMAGKLNGLLEGYPRMSVLMVDSAKDGEDGGCVLCCVWSMSYTVRHREQARLASRNIPNVSYVPAEGLNVYEMLRRDVLLLTAAGADAVVARLRRQIKR